MCRHDTVPKGEGAAPTPVPKALESVTVAVTKQSVNIDAFSFLEEDGQIKLYVSLEADLANVTDAQAAPPAVHATRHEGLLPCRPPSTRQSLVWRRPTRGGRRAGGGAL